MPDFANILETLAEPSDYFKGLGQEPEIPTPTNLLIFLRRSKEQLQQKALQNRSHHRYVLLFNLETAGQVHVDHHQIPFASGQALLISPFQFHHFGQLESSKLKWLICTFELAHSDFLNTLRNRSIDVNEVLVEALHRLLVDWAVRLETTRSPEHQDLQLQATLLKLLVALKQNVQQESGETLPETEDNLLRHVNRLLIEWRGRQVLVADLAQALHLSESRFGFLFKEVSGISIGSYIQNYRINRAMSLLRTTDLPIAEVALEAGFGSPQAFCRIFKQKTELSPRSYRKG